MAPRPYWKGYLKLSLVSCPIALHTATSASERIAFRQINKETGNRLRQQLVDEVTREPVETADKGRGYEYAKGAYHPGRGRGDRRDRDREQAHDRDRQVRAARADRRALFRHPYYIDAERRRRPGSLRGDPRRDARQGDGRARPRRAREARARDHAAALGEGTDGHDAALCL